MSLDLSAVLFVIALSIYLLDYFSPKKYKLRRLQSAKSKLLDDQLIALGIEPIDKKAIIANLFSGFFLIAFISSFIGLVVFPYINVVIIPMSVLGGFLLALIAKKIADAAYRKGKSWLSFFWLSLFVPIIMAIVVVILPKLDSINRGLTPAKVTHGPLGKCPFCKEEVKPDALICKHCGSNIDQKVEEAVTSNADADNSATLETNPETISDLEFGSYQKKFKIIAISVIISFVLVAAGVFVYSNDLIQPPKDPNQKIETTDYLRTNEWLTAMNGCGFDIANAEIDNPELGSFKYTPQGEQSKKWAFQYSFSSEEESSYVTNTLVISRTFDEKISSCFAKKFLGIESLDISDPIDVGEIYVYPLTSRINLHEITYQ